MDSNSLTPLPSPRPRYVEMLPAQAYAPEQGEDLRGGLVDYWRLIRRRKGTVILVTFVGIVVGVLALVDREEGGREAILACGVPVLCLTSAQAIMARIPATPVG